MALKNPILMATIGRAQGIRGEVRVKSHTADPLSLGDYGVLFDKDGKRYEVLDIRPGKNVVVVRFLGVQGRNEAEKLTGTDLFIDRESLNDEELDEDEFFYADLEGMDAYDESGKFWGTISSVYDFGGGDVIELRMKGQKPALIPFTMDAVPAIDLNDRRILVEPIAAGLVVDDDGEAQDGKPKSSKGPEKGSDKGNQ